MLTLLAETGLGTCLLIIILMVGLPLAWWHDAKEKPEAATPGQTDN